MAAAVALLAAAPAARAQLGVNLLVNADAEAGAGATGSETVPVPDWTTTGAFTVIRYAFGPSGFTETSPTPPAPGLNFFAGGPASALSTAQQVVDLSGFSALIDAGEALFTLSGYLGGFADQNDTAQVDVLFRDSLLAPLGAAVIGPVTNVDRADATAVLFRSAGGVVPATATSAVVTISMVRNSGTYNNGYADSLSFVIQSAPEPGTLLLAGVGLAGLALRRRRRAA